MDAICWTAHFHWTKPAGQVDGYYFGMIGGTIIGPWKPTCSPSSMTRLPADATDHSADMVAGDIVAAAWICAYNSAGVSPPALFPSLK